MDIGSDNLSINPQYQGTATVVSVTNIFGWQYIEINKTYVAASTAETGTIRKIKRAISGTSSTFYDYNGHRQYTEPSVNFSNTHVFWNNNDMVKALTNYKTGITSSTPVVGTSSISNTKKIIKKKLYVCVK